MKEAILLQVFQRAGHLYVVPSVIAEHGFEALPSIVEVNGQDDLQRALTDGKRHATDALARPKAERFPNGKPFWETIGMKSWDAFVRGVTAVDVTLLAGGVELVLMQKDPKRPALLPVGEEKLLPADTPMSDVAQAVIEMLDKQS